MAPPRSSVEASSGEGRGTEPVNAGFASDDHAVEVALIAALTNSDNENTASSDPGSGEDHFDAIIPFTSIEKDQFPEDRKEVASSVPVENTNGGNDGMPVLTSSFEPGSSATALKHDSTDPVLFNFSDWEGLSPAVEPSVDMLGDNVQLSETPAHQFQPFLELFPFPGHQVQGRPRPEPSLPPHSQQHFLVASNPHLMDKRTGRRRSQSVPPSSEPGFAQRMANGKRAIIGTPQLAPAFRNGMVLPPHPPPHLARSATGPVITSRLTSRPYMVVTPPTHPHPAGMMTEPASPAPHFSHYIPQKGYKRPFCHVDEHDSDRGRGKPGSKRRARQKTPSPAGRGATPTPSLDPCGVEALMESIRCLIGQKLDEVRATVGGSSVELLRATHREHNRFVTELNEPLSILDGDWRPTDVCNAPATGGMIKVLNHNGMDRVLQMYDVPLVTSMFLFEKKMVYLRFVGANRVLMHKVLD